MQDPYIKTMVPKFQGIQNYKIITEETLLCSRVMTTKPITWIGDINTTTPKGILQKSVNNSPFQIVDNNTSSRIEHIQLTEFIFQFFFRLED